MACVHLWVIDNSKAVPLYKVEETITPLVCLCGPEEFVFCIEIPRDDDAIVAIDEFLKCCRVELDITVWRAVVCHNCDALASSLKLDSHNVVKIWGDIGKHCVLGDIDGYSPATGVGSVSVASRSVAGNARSGKVMELCLVKEYNIRFVVIEIFLKLFL